MIGLKLINLLSIFIKVIGLIPVERDLQRVIYCYQYERHQKAYLFPILLLGIIDCWEVGLVEDQIYVFLVCVVPSFGFLHRRGAKLGEERSKEERQLLHEELLLQAGVVRDQPIQKVVLELELLCGSEHTG